MPRSLALSIGALLAAVLIACGGGSATSPTPPPATTTSTELGAPRPELGRLQEHIELLAGEVGARPPDSPQEDEVVAYARQQFESWGYRVEIQAFPAAAPAGLLRTASLTVDERDLHAVALEGGASGEAEGPLVDAGTGREEEFPPEAAGAVVLVQRRDVPFADMARRAEEAGAVGVVIANNEPGLFIGELDPPSELPVIAVEQADGEPLRAMLARGPVEVAVSVREDVEARNVIARPPSGSCRSLAVAHHDSVSWAPGANDNASGVALVLELARAAAAADLSGSCFALFGAEELGLLGSAFFVSELSEAERDELEAVFNYDVVAAEGRLLLVGSRELSERAEALAAEADVDAQQGVLPEDVGSDHVSFLDAGIPALMLTTPDIGLIHTPRDTLANVEPEPLEAVAEVGFALLQQGGSGSAVAHSSEIRRQSSDR